MVSVKILDNLFWVGINDNRNILFEGLWPIPQGITYNSYIIKGLEKTVLIDTVDKFYSKEFLANVKEVVEPSKIDHIILNHLEPDHSGSLEEILKYAPKAKVIGSQMAINIAKAYYHQDFNNLAVKDGEIISLGDRTLKIITAPWIHWPETIFTYDVEDQVLFSGDAFGTFGAVNGNLFDDQKNVPSYEIEMKRYFADIISHYSQFVIKAGEKIQNLPIKILCTTHGTIYRNNPNYPISKYLLWSSGKDENKVLIIYGSMYGHTKECAEYFGAKLREKGINVILRDLGIVHPSYVLTDILDSKVVMIGSPTYDGQIFPLVSNIIEYMTIKHVRPKIFAIFTNYSWGSNIIDTLKGRLSEIGMRVLEPQLLVKGKISEEDKKKADILVENIVNVLQ
ncbi:MAG: FprA family A-type flavoprotein [Nitrososphaeria archaeon]